LPTLYTEWFIKLTKHVSSFSRTFLHQGDRAWQEALVNGMTTSIFLRLILGFEHGNNTPLEQGSKHIPGGFLWCPIFCLTSKDHCFCWFMSSMHLSREQWGTTKGTVVNVAWFEQGNDTSLEQGSKHLTSGFLWCFQCIAFVDSWWFMHSGQRPVITKQILGIL
jgi:hypothetical protein